MPQPPHRFLNSLRTLEAPFTAEEVQRRFPDLRPSSISVYLSLAKRAGYIEQVGQKRYRHRQPDEPTQPLPRIVEAITRALRAEIMPSVIEGLVLWSNEDLAPFVTDGFPVPFVVIEGSSANVATASSILEREHRTALARNHEDLGRRIREESAQVFLLPSRRLDSTRLLAAGFRVPTLGRLLIPVLHMPALLPGAAIRLLAESTADLRETVLALPSRRAAIRLGAFLAWLLDTLPDHPIHPQAERYLPEHMVDRR